MLTDDARVILGGLFIFGQHTALLAALVLRFGWLEGVAMWSAFEILVRAIRSKNKVENE